MKKFSKFIGGATAVYPTESIDILEVIRLFKDDTEIKTLIGLIRNETDKDKKDALKMKLPYITVAGEFTYRENKSIVVNSYTWACPIDIDVKPKSKKHPNGENPDIIVDDVINLMKQHPSIVFIAKSPRGNGIKAVVQLAGDSYDFRDQYNVFRDVIYPHFAEAWNVKLDIAQGKLSQPFYISHDPDLFINRHPKPLIIDINMINPDVIMSGNVSTPIKDLQPFVRGIINQRDNKWDYFNRVAMFVGGLCAGDILRIKNETALKSLIGAAKQNNSIKDYDVAIKQITDGFEHGLKYPIDKDTLKSKKNIQSILYRLEIQSITKNPFVRVGDDFYKKITKTNMNGDAEPYLKTIKRITITDDYGLGFIAQIPKYNMFCNVPNYINHRYVINGNYNLFHPFTHKIIDGEWDTIKKLITHIFGDQYEMSLDYFRLLFLKPTQILPVVCLVSKQNQTGKTTMVDFISLWLKGNTAIISTKDIEGNFNQHFATKHFIAIDESDLQKEKTTARIKQMATQKSETRKGKFQDETEIDYFAKMFILSNNERSFINIKDDDVRYWVRKVETFDKKDFDPEFLSKCKAEIPAFSYFLVNSELTYKQSKGRAWFDDAAYNTVWLDAAKEENKTALYKDLMDRLIDWFGRNEFIDVINFRTLDIMNAFYSTNNNFSAKYLTRVLKDEFNLTSIYKRETCNLEENLAKLPGHWFSVTKKYILNNIDITDIQPNDLPPF